MSERSRSEGAWRSILYVPAHVERYVRSASRSAADAIQLDLEDSVPFDQKQAARGHLPAAVGMLREGRADVLVRINRPLALAVPDIQAAVRCGVDALSLAKVEGAEHLRLLAEVVEEEERLAGRSGPPTRLIAIVESPRALARVEEIASASARVVAVMLGSEDFALECEAEADDDVLLMPKQLLVLGARAAGVAPLGYIGSVARLREPDALRSMAGRSRRFGFQGATCIHPSHVDILNDAFGVTPEQADHARRIVQAYDHACALGLGACVVEGAMVDLPVAARARRLLQRLPVAS